MTTFKKIIFLTLASTSLTALIACSHKRVDESSKTLSSLPQNRWKPQIFSSHPDWLAVNVDPLPIEQIRKQLESIGGVPLKNRGESHITVISPPEYAKLQSKLNMDAMELSAHQMDIQKTRWQPLCVARAVDQKDAKKITYYIVVESPGLLEIRRELLRLYVKNGGEAADFDLLNYHPHITIGFTDRDLFENDGVIKDVRHCSFDLATPAGEKITSWNI